MRLKRLTLPYIFSVLAFLLLTSCSELLKRNDSIIEVIPTTAFVILETQNIHKLEDATKNNKVLAKITDLNQLDALKGQLWGLMDSLKTNNIELNIKGSVAISIHKTGSKQSDVLLTTQISNSKFNLEEIVHKLSNFTQILERNYDNNLVYSINNNGLRFYFTYINEFLFVTKSSTLITDAIRQSNASTNLKDNLTFQKAYATANQKDILNVFIHVDGLRKVLETHSKKPLTDLRNFSDWMALDLSLHDNTLLLTGISCTKDSLRSMHRYFDREKASAPDLFEIAPANTELLLSYHFDDFSNFFKNRKRTLNKTRRFSQMEKTIEKDLFQMNSYMELIEDEYAFILSGKKITEENHLGIVEIRDTEKWESLLSEKSDSITPYRGYPIYRLQKSDFCEFLLGSDFEFCKSPYWTLIDDYWVFANSSAVLKNLVNDYKRNNNLGNQENFLGLKDKLSNTSNIWMYGATMGNKSHFNQLLNKKKLPRWQQSLNELDYFEGWMLQLDAQYDYFNVNLTTKLKEDIAKTVVRLEWNLELKDSISGNIQKVWNHKSKEWELMVQDKQNILYLLSAEGEILWQKELEKQILGNIHQVDLYRNNKLQYLFNTSDKIYVLDRNGSNVADYPIDLEDRTELPIAVFDYDNSRNYRLVIPGFSELNMLDGFGKHISGWLGDQLRGYMITTPRHFVHDEKDYIVSFSNKKELKILNRKGMERITVEEQFDVNSLSTIEFRVSGKKAYFEFVENTGSIVTIDLDGKITRTETLKEGQQYITSLAGQKFIRKGSYLFSEDEAFKFDLDDEQSFSMEIYSEADLNLFVLSLSNNNKVYVVNHLGEKLNGFPVYGNAQTFLGKLNDNRLSLIVGSDDGTLYKYSLESH